MQIKVWAHPNSKKPRMEKDFSGGLHAYVRQPALDGKANRAILEALAGYFNIAKSRVILVKGKKSKQKTFYIQI